MKTKIIVGLCVALFGFWLWCQRPGLALENVLPSHPLVFTRLVHAEEHTQELINSDFGKSVASIDLPDVLIRNNFSKKDVRDFKRWQRDLVEFWQNPLIKQFLGKEVSLSVYRKNNSYEVFVTMRLTVSTRMAELVGQLPNRWGRDVRIKREKYHGRIINHILFTKQHTGLAYVRIRDLLIAAPESLGRLEEVIDVYEHRQEPLQVDDSYNFVRQNAYPASDGLVFVNLNLFSHIWRGEMDSKLTPLGYESSAFPVYGLSYMPGVVSKYKVMVGLDQAHMPSGMRKVFSCPAMTNDTLKLVPVNAIAYNWGGCYDLDEYWTAVKSHLQEYPEVLETASKFKEKLEKHFGINIRKDVLPLLGHEIGGYLTDVDMQGTYPFPLPRMLLFISVKDRPAVERLMAKLGEQPAIPLKEEEYNHIDIHYISSSLGANMDPGYCFLDNYLLIATSRQLLKRSIDAYSDSLRSIVSDDVIEQFSLDGSAKFHSVTLMKTAELSRRAEDFLGWVDKYLSDRVSMAAAYKQDGDSKKQELDEAIADKSAELLLAQKKLTQLKNTSLPAADLQDPAIVDGAIENLNREEESIRDDIANYTEQREDLSRLLDTYALGAKSAKLTMYNMDNVVSPVLKGLESINAQAVTVRFGNKILETEFLVK